MTYFCDLFEPTADVETAVKKLNDLVTKLYVRYWREIGEKWFGQPFRLNAELFVNLWMSKTIKIFLISNERNEPVGFLVGMLYTPMQYQSGVFEVEDFFAETPEYRQYLMDYVWQAIRFLGCDEIRYMTKDKEDLPLATAKGWRRGEDFIVQRYTKR